MAEYVTLEMLNVVKKVNWKNKEVQTTAENRLRSIVSQIGYPKELLNHSLITEIYGGLQMNKSAFFGNVMKLRRWLVDVKFNKLRTPLIDVSFIDFLSAAY